MSERVSVVVPVYGNEATLVELRDRVEATLGVIAGVDFELIFVDDASPDGSWSVIEAMASTDEQVVGLRLASNVGQLRASCAGVDAATGGIFVSMDADLEHPPEAIPRLLRALGEGHDLVVARRMGRSADRIRSLGSHTVNLVARSMRLPVPDVGSSFLACTPPVAAAMRSLVGRTGRQMVLPSVFGSAANPTIVEIEMSSTAPSSYALGRVMGLGGEFLAAELAPAAARRLLVASGCVLLLGVRARWRRQALWMGASLGVLGTLGVLAPSAFKRNGAKPLYSVESRVGHGLCTRSTTGPGLRCDDVSDTAVPRA